MKLCLAKLKLLAPNRIYNGVGTKATSSGRNEPSNHGSRVPTYHKRLQQLQYKYCNSTARKLRKPPPRGRHGFRLHAYFLSSERSL